MKFYKYLYLFIISYYDCDMKFRYLSHVNVCKIILFYFFEFYKINISSLYLLLIAFEKLLKWLLRKNKKQKKQINIFKIKKKIKKIYIYIYI